MHTEAWTLVEREEHSRHLHKRNDTKREALLLVRVLPPRTWKDDVDDDDAVPQQPLLPFAADAERRCCCRCCSEGDVAHMDLMMPGDERDYDDAGEV